MPVQVAAHGFELTDALRDHCADETRDRLQSLAQKMLTTKWMLSLERDEQVAHLLWDDGIFHGDVTVKTNDMYASIHQCAKKGAEQMKKAHEKRHEHKKVSAGAVLAKEVESDEE